MELINWWKTGVVEGENIEEAFNNYFRSIFSQEFAKFVEKDDLNQTRRQINAELAIRELRSKHL